MGQKSNLLTLKPFYNEINAFLYNNKIFLNLKLFTDNFNILLYKKGILLCKKEISVINGQIMINLTIFYRTLKLNNLKYKLLSNSRNGNKKPSSSIFINLFNNLNIKYYNLSVLVLNKFNNSKLTLFLYKKTNRYIRTLFARQFNLYLDFLKISSLLINDLINPYVFLFILSLIFKNISKRNHSRFFSFIKFYFNLVVFNIPNSIKSLRRIQGLKLNINGRLQGKPRSTNIFISEGSLPIQSFSKSSFSFNKTIHTKLGAFGLKLLIYQI